MKKLSYVLTAMLVFLSLTVGQVRANEGKLVLKTSEESKSICVGDSVFIDGRYRVLLSCRGLEMAPDPVFNRYMAWTKEEDGKLRRLGEIERGKLQGSTEDPFTAIEISLESKGSPLKPSERIVMTGDVVAFEFGVEEEKKEEIVVMDEGIDEVSLDSDVVVDVDDRGAVTPTTESTASGFSKVLSAVLKALLAGFVVVILVVGISSYFSSRKKI